MALTWRENKDYMEIVADLMGSEEVQALEKFVHHKVTNRLAHSISVSYRSYKIAKFLGLDEVATARAALLHDLFYYESCDKHCVGGKGHNYEHPRIALENALKLTELSEKEQDIIVKHMFGATLALPLYGESYLVTWMDKHSAICEWCAGIMNFIKNKEQSKAQAVEVSE